MAGGGHIIIRRNKRAAAELETVQEQLGPNKKAKLLAILAKDEADWTPKESKFVGHCIQDAEESYEE
jgi:hypothetical protein